MRAKLVSKPGISDHRARENPNPDTAELVVVDGEQVWRVNAHRELLEVFKDELRYDKEMFKEEKMIYQDTVETMPVPWPDQHLRKGLNPYKQLIAKYVIDQGERVSFSEIYDYLTNSKQVLKRGSRQKEIMKRYLKELHEDGVLVRLIGPGDRLGYEADKNDLSDVYPSWRGSFYWYEDGKHLVKQMMHKKVGEENGLYKSKLIDYISSDIDWCSPTAADRYIDDLLDEEALSISDGYLSTSGPLKPIRNE